MSVNIQQIYQKTILPLSEHEQLKLATLILNKISRNTGKKTETEKSEKEHPLSVIGRIKVDVGTIDFADKHDFYAHGKLED